MKFYKILSPVVASVVALSSIVSASVLGTSHIKGYSVPIGQDTYLCHNTYLSDQSGVGLQSENYIVYTPNAGITPVVGYGNTVYGSLDTTLNDANRLIGQGKNIVGGINADYFSFQTGVPMSNLTIGGEVITKDSTAKYGFGVDQNGNGFMGESYITAVLTRQDGRTMNIECINKYRQPYAMYLLNSKFSNRTQNTTLGLDIIIEADTDALYIGKTIKGTVTYALCNNGSIEIPKGSLVLTVDVNAPMFNDIADIAVGDTVEISVAAPTEPRWENAIIGMGSTGEYILSGGVVTQGLSAGAHPRSAVGITNDGSIMLYTIDGRQTGHSYGVQLTTLAQRMKELGCVEAINLDGGGSTTIVAKLPGDSGLTLLNSPSEGSQRKVATNIFLQNNLSATGKIGNLQIYPLEASYVMKGASITLSAKGTDTGYHPLDVTRKVDFSVDGNKNSTVTQGGVFTAKDSGSVFVRASYDGVSSTHEVFCVESPTDIQIKDSTGENLTALKVKRNESIDLSAVPAYGYHSVITEDSCFDWRITGNIGEIDNSGKFTASNSIGASGTITVSAGNTSKEIKVYVLPDGSENEELLYSKIEAEITEGVLKGTIFNEYSVDTQKDKLKITADGAVITPEYDGHSFSAAIPLSTHKIRITATNDLGYTSVWSTTLEDISVFENPFADTQKSWARDILSYMYAQKLVSGENTSAGLSYNPQKEMTRSEFAVLICNFLKIGPNEYAGISLPYTDINDIPKWALNHFKALYSLGILQGRADTTGGSYADPKTGISRAEACTIIARLLPDGLKKAEITASDKGDIPKWAVDGFKILMADGTVSGYQDGTLLPLKKLTKAEAAKLLYSLY